MKEIKITKYQCEKCTEIYGTKEEAEECEKQPITQDKGVKPGDRVLILNGDGAGEQGIVESTSVYSKTWGHYAWKTYWHTVGVTAKLTNSWGHRDLTFQDYKLIK